MTARCVHGRICLYLPVGALGRCAANKHVVIIFPRGIKHLFGHNLAHDRLIIIPSGGEGGREREEEERGKEERGKKEEKEGRTGKEGRMGER